MLPRLNLAEPAVRNHIFDVARYWLKDIGIDGWRLDVAHEISPDFWREFRKVRRPLSAPSEACVEDDREH
jgi:cyclomaltodextrinase